MTGPIFIWSIAFDIGGDYRTTDEKAPTAAVALQQFWARPAHSRATDAHVLGDPHAIVLNGLAVPLYKLSPCEQQLIEEMLAEQAADMAEAA